MVSTIRCVVILGLVAALRTGDACGANLRSLPMPTPSGSAEPRFAPGPDGTLAFSWLEPRTGRGRAGPTGPDDSGPIAGCPVNGPALDAAGDDVGITWYTTASESAQVLAAWSSDGGQTFAPPVRVDDGAPLGRVGMVLLPDKSAFGTWLEGGAKKSRVLGRRVSPTGERGEALTIARTSAARASGFPQVARVGTDLFFAWTEAGQVPRIRGARLRLGPDLGSK